MQPKILLSSFAFAMAVSGVAYAGGDQHATQAKASQSASASSVTREQTKAMQRALTARNLYQGQADGVWGPKTESALRNFQTQSGLDATGQLNEPTARALGIDQTGQAQVAPPATAVERQPVSGSDRAAPAPGAGTATPHSQPQLENSSTNVQLQSLSQEQAREMQQRLQLLGFYRGEVDGKVGEGTRAALQRYFQRQAELAQQGVISPSAISQFGTEVSDVQPVSGQDGARPAR
jgi:peptidoglycan hydrolase-like protein with peptidoglycan-binding domain